MTSGGTTKHAVLRYCSGTFFVAAMILAIQYMVNGEKLTAGLALLAFIFGLILAFGFWAAGLPKREPGSDEDEWYRSIR